MIGFIRHRGGSEHKLMPGQKKKNNFFQANQYLSIGVVDTNNYYHSNNVIMIIIIYGKCFLRQATAYTAHLKQTTWKAVSCVLLYGVL